MPTKTCSNSILDALGDEVMYLGYAIVISSVIILFIIICSCPLWNYDRFREAEEQQKLEYEQYLQGIEFSDIQNGIRRRN